MARDFAGSSTMIRDHSAQFVTRVLNLDDKSWSHAQRFALENLSLALAMIPGISNWSSSEKELADQMIRAKAGADEALYLRLMQKHAAVRDAFIRLGSKRI